MSVNNYKELASHFGHRITCTIYGYRFGVRDLTVQQMIDQGENAAIECQDCGCVLFDLNNED